MFVSLTSADTTGQPAENAKVVAEEMERWLRGKEFRERMLGIAGVTIQDVVGYELVYAWLGAGLISAGTAGPAA